MTLSAALPEQAYGNWDCRCGQTTYTGIFSDAREKTCTVCSTPLANYRELVLSDPERKVIGSPDFALQLSPMILIPVEFKSINAAGWEKLKENAHAIANHELQVLYYGRMMVRNGKLVPTAIIIYVLKEFKWGVKPYMEFRATESGRTSPSLDVMDQRAEAIRDNKADDPLPERLGVCPGPSAPRAKECGQCTLCFSTNS
jgi:hypothetical protein